MSRRSSRDARIQYLGSDGSSSVNTTGRGRRFSSPATNAYLGLAFNACAVSPGSNSPLGVDASLLRYRRSSGLPLSSSSPNLTGASSSSLLPSPLFSLHQLLQFHCSLSPPTPLCSPASLLCHDGPTRTPPSYRTPVKVEVEEDVLVMDGVLVSDSGSSGRSRTPSEPRSSISSGGSKRSQYKTELCHSWVESKICRQGSLCQYAHGEEELRRPGAPKGTKSEGSGKSVSSAESGVYGNRSRYGQGWSSRFSTESSSSNSSSGRRVASSPPGKTRLSSSSTEAGPFVWPPTEAEDKYITEVLYGPSRTERRLPVFVDICSCFE